MLNTSKKSNLISSPLQRFAALFLVIAMSVVQLTSVFALDVGVTPFVPNPQTPYATQFIALANGQQWFLDLIENVLNVEAKSINTLSGKADLKNILTLGAYNKEIAGEIPRAIGELSELRYIYLAKNELSGTLPAELFNCTKLKEIDLSENQLSGSISSDFSKLTSLETLLLWGNDFNGVIPASLGTIGTLKNLDLASNKLTGGIPPALGVLTNLEILSLSNNPLEGELPADLGNLSNLVSLLAWNCDLTGTILGELGGLSKLQVLDISQNNFTGSVPSSFAGLFSLQKLAVSDNKLSGDLPEVVASITTLRILDLARNEFSGEIPASYAALNSIVKIDFDGNKLGGEIPGFLGDFLEISVLWLRDNQFVGNLPNTIAAKSAAGKDVRINNNYLYGAAAKAVAENSGNFINNTTKQYKITMEAYTKTDKNKAFDVYAAFKNAAVSGTLATKPKLPADNYEVVCVSTLSKPEEWYKITKDGKGITITLLKDIPYKDALLFELRMLPFDSSEPNIVVRFRLGTEAKPKDASEYVDKPEITEPKELQSGGDFGDVFKPEETPKTTGTLKPGETSKPAATSKPSETPKPLTTSKPPVNPGQPESRERYVYGYSAGTVRPDAPTTREEVAVILHRIAGNSTTNFKFSYADIEIERWSAASIAFVTQNGIMTGRGGNVFDPTDKITRAEFAAALVRFKGYDLALTANFSDVSGHWANAYIGAAVKNGIFSGYTDGTFHPDALITRAEIMTAINRMLGRNPDKSAILASGIQNPYTDLPVTHWAYAEVLEATIAHTSRVNPETGIEEWTEGTN